MIKAIIFDVDGVLTNSVEGKDTVFKDVLTKFDLYTKPGVKELLTQKLNRRTFIEALVSIHDFNKELVYNELDAGLNKLWGRVEFIPNTVEFICSNDFQYFINTSMPSTTLEIMLKNTLIENKFSEKMCGDHGSKIENTNYILEKYSLEPDGVLFIDDTVSHIENVKTTGVHCLHFTNRELDLEDYINNLM